MSKRRKYFTEEERIVAQRERARNYQERMKARMEADPEFRERQLARYREYWHANSHKWRKRKIEYMHGYYAKNKSKIIKKTVDRNRRRYQNSEDFRASVLSSCKKWRDAHRSYDILRKTISCWMKSKNPTITGTRKARMESLLAGCTEPQKIRIMGKLKEFGLEVPK